MIVVAHGLWSSANSIRFTAVSIVQPCWPTSRVRRSLIDSSSVIIPAPVYTISMVGTTISFAGMAIT